MSETSAPSLFKKKDGTLTVKPAENLLTWTPITPNAIPSIAIPIPTITNLQATPPTSAKVMIKVFALPANSPPEAQPDQYVFNFTCADARPLADAVQDTLKTAIQTAKASTVAEALASTPTVAGAAAAITPAIAATIIAPAQQLDLSEKTLLASSDLQKELLSSSPALLRLFSEMVISTQSITPTQFWSTRLALLRAFAIDRHQRKGPYNVLAAIKPKTVDNVIKMSLTREQIREIFEQHPIVRKAYDETVPGKCSEDGFWKRFFGSGLFKRLRGETGVTREDDVIDRYMDFTEADNQHHPPSLPIPPQISLTQNLNNISIPTGNRPDLTMRAHTLPLPTTLNSLSYKFIDTVTPADTTASLPSAPLADLLPPPPPDELPLHLKPPSSATSPDAPKLKTLPATPLYKALLQLTQPARISLPASAQPTSSTSYPAATSQITTLLHARAASHKQNLTSITNDQIPENVRLCHAAQMEMVRHFYRAFLSGDGKRVNEAGRLVGSLERGGDRVKALRDGEGGEVLLGVEECLSRAVDWWGSVSK